MCRYYFYINIKYAIFLYSHFYLKKMYITNINFARIKSITDPDIRHCAIWNPSLGLLGAWDTDNIQTIQANEVAASCITDR